MSTGADRPASAGEQLRADLTDALARESATTGVDLVFDEREQRAVDAACRCADHIELLERVIAGESAAEQLNTSALSKAIAEVRQLDRSIMEHLARLDMGSQWAAGAAKNPHTQAMARARWGATPRPARRVK